VRLIRAGLVAAAIVFVTAVPALSRAEAPAPIIRNRASTGSRELFVGRIGAAIEAEFVEETLDLTGPARLVSLAP